MGDIVLPAQGFDGDAGVDTRRRRRPSREDVTFVEEDLIRMITGKSPDGRRNTGEIGCKIHGEGGASESGEDLQRYGGHYTVVGGEGKRRYEAEIK